MNRGPEKGLRKVFFPFIILSVFLCQLIVVAASKSPTSDEFSHHIASGYSYIIKHDLRLNPSMPPLPKLLSGIPLVLAGFKAEFNNDSWLKADTPGFSRQFFNHWNSDQTDRITFLARLPIIFLSVLFGWALYKFGVVYIGQIGALVSLVLFCFCPDIIAHSALATSDLSVSFFFFLAIVWYIRFLKEPGRKNLIICSIFSALSFLSKSTAILLPPIFILIAFFGGNSKALRFKFIISFIGLCLLVIWAGYLFEWKPLLHNARDLESKASLIKKAGGEGLLSAALHWPLPMPTFFSGVAGMLLTRVKGTHAFLFGQWSENGWWYYYFAAYVIKNTATVLIFFISAVLFFKKISKDKIFLAGIFVPISFFFLITVFDKAQAGIRYFLPIYPFIFMACGGVVSYFLSKKIWLLKMACLVLLVWHVFEAALIFPDDLAYFSPIVGGADNGYKYLRDSNIDWGQDLKKLGAFVGKEDYGELVLFLYAPADPAFYGIHFRVIEEDEFLKPRKAVYAIGAHRIDAVRWVSQYQPTKIIGHSIFIYDLR